MAAKTRAVRIVAVLVVLLVIFLATQVTRTRQDESAAFDGEIKLLRQLAVSDDSQLAQVLDRSVVAIAAGDFVMGSDAGRSDERPQHSVYLDAYEIDRYEITNAQYRRFLQVTGRKAPLYWAENEYPSGQADYPVVGVSWENADAYCQWAGKRLPTEAEWEKACRGSDGRLYPWGNAWEPKRANVDVSGRALRPPSQTEFEPTVWDAAWQLLCVTPARPQELGLRPVGSYPDGASPFGVMDLVGNASEWVWDWYNWNDYSQMPARNPRVTGPPWNHCVRGSPWHDPVGTANWVQSMSRCSARSSSHEVRDPRTGFRCARSVSAGTP